MLACAACARQARKGRWAALAYSPCTAAGDAGPEPVRWRRVPHVVAERGGTVCCDRCRGTVPLHRRHTFEGRRCPARWPGEGRPVPGPGDWGAWAHRLLERPAA
eukprot:9850411-Lingulodinium_polyedra.AAC.1